MVTEERITRKDRNTFLIILASLILAFLIYYGIMSVIAPGRKLSELKRKYELNDPGSTAANAKYYSDSAYVALLKGKAFLQSRITLAETDSIYMSLNLADSIAELDISGVTVHKAKITKITMSRILRSGNNQILLAMLSSPFNIENDYSTIKKEPLMIKMAPKDTSEYKPDIMPDTTDIEPVNYILQMDNGLRIYVYQDTDTTTTDRHKLFFFDLNSRMRNAWQSMKSVVMFKVPDYHPFIKIRMARADAKIFYRALPRKGQVAVFL